MSRLTRAFLLLAGLGVLAGCAHTPPTIKPADELYREAYDAMNSNSFNVAKDRLNTVMARYPFTPYAVQAHLDSLYVYLQLKDPDTAAEEADRFVRENPRHPDIDYAYYMKGLAYYEQVSSFLEDTFHVDLAQRDMESSQKAFKYFGELLTRFPDSKYSVDARERMVELKDRMARHEIYVADYYVRRGAWISALDRATNVVKNFQGTPAEIDALMIMAESYDHLKLPELAKTARAVLAANPDRKPVVLKSGNDTEDND